ncbi:N-acetylmuramoyl-L-alanine amidase [Limoniibacter endophyticus]|nr:N-acetylmuramoyl-L-alanine amidase [Limoniibacter endophyticus]
MVRSANIVWRALALLFFILFAGGVHAQANEGRSTLYDLKTRAQGDELTLEMTFDKEPAPHWFSLRSPYRLVVDFSNTHLALDPEGVKARGIAKDIRYGSHGPNRSRVLVVLKEPFLVKDVTVDPAGEDGYRLTMQLRKATLHEFETGLSDQATTTAATSTPKQDRIPRSTKKFTVVIDPGHGGIDPGAVGKSGTIEKTITLAVGLELRKALEATGRYKVEMTRSDDSFMRLDERIKIAREQQANLFISIHADTIRQEGIRGATVYTVSDKASDAEAAALAARENLSDSLGQMEVADESHQIADILYDLIRRETHSFSIRFARTLIGEMKDSVALINNPHRYAGFRVLRAPDVPSVLLELGYLSNEEDESLLRDPEWRGKIVKNIVSAVEAFEKASGAR